MCVRLRLPESRIGRTFTASATGLLALLAVLYLFLLADQAYLARRCSRILDRLELLRMGDSAEDFDSAVNGCPTEGTNSGRICILTGGALHFGMAAKLVSDLPDDWGYKVSWFLDRAGLRYWRFVTSDSVQNRRIQSISVGLFVAGRYETLGARWGISEALPVQYDKLELSADQQRTYMGWFNITSVPGGEGFSIHATPASTESELRARRINRKCLLTYRGCDGLCELLPDAVPVSRERKSTWGGWTGAPPSKCEMEER